MRSASTASTRKRVLGSMKGALRTGIREMKLPDLLLEASAVAEAGGKRHKPRVHLAA
jgi:hypothetical protein